MKPFDLEAAKAGKKLVTRNGRDVNAFAYVSDLHSDYPCTAHIEGEGWITYSRDGTEYRAAGESPSDLFIAPEQRTVYVNFWRGGTCDWYETEDEARAGLNARALKIAVPVTFEV